LTDADTRPILSLAGRTTLQGAALRTRS